MKPLRTVMTILSLGLALSAGNVLLTTDALTGLPIDPASDSRFHLGNAPTKIPDYQICSSKMQANSYSVYDTVEPTVAWYAAHLKGFHQTHAYFDKRSHNTFYNDAGTLAVIVMGEIGPEGQNVNTYSVTYYRLQPGLSPKALASFGQHNTVCG